ncbi:MAG: FadR/GntR family transcriptional regulator [Spirochaetes bacterium]|nr:FadR/GntR family transcriptional regulator [Spirochaetota bacterium]
MEKKREELLRKLQGMIVDQHAFPDGKLPPERVLAEKLHVSRNLLREVMINLEVLGSIDIRERQGAFITIPNSEDFAASLKFASLYPDEMLINLMEMRLIIEPPIAGIAALRRTDKELADMKNCIAKLIEVHDSPNRGASSGAQWDSTLHMLIVQAARNPLLTRLYEGLSATMGKYIVVSRVKLLALADWPQKIIEEHRALVDAIEAGDEWAASEAQKKHLGSALEMLRELSK